jgi:hypothetical protein
LQSPVCSRQRRETTNTSDHPAEWIIYTHTSASLDDERTSPLEDQVACATNPYPSCPARAPGTQQNLIHNQQRTQTLTKRLRSDLEPTARNQIQTNQPPRPCAP